MSKKKSKKRFFKTMKAGCTNDMWIHLQELNRGDITPLIYELIKDSPFIDDIFKVSSVKKEEVKHVRKERISGPANTIGSRGFSFENWLSQSVQSIPVQGNELDTTGEAVPGVEDDVPF